MKQRTRISKGRAWPGWYVTDNTTVVVLPTWEAAMRYADAKTRAEARTRLTRRMGAVMAVAR